MQDIIVHVDTYSIEEKLDTIIENQEALQEIIQSDFLSTRNQIKESATLLCLPLTIILIFIFIVRSMK